MVVQDCWSMLVPLGYDLYRTASIRSHLYSFASMLGFYQCNNHNSSLVLLTGPLLLKYYKCYML